MRAASCRVLAEFGTSDHAPVVATFTEEEAAGEPQVPR
jgi:hypothetical protein